MTIAKINALLDKPAVSLFAAATTSGVAGLIDWAQSVTGTASPVAALTMLCGLVTGIAVSARAVYAAVREIRKKDRP